MPHHPVSSVVPSFLAPNAKSPHVLPFPPLGHHSEAKEDLPAVPEDEEDAISMRPAAAASTTGIGKRRGWG